MFHMIICTKHLYKFLFMKQIWFAADLLTLTSMCFLFLHIHRVRSSVEYLNESLVAGLKMKKKKINPIEEVKLKYCKKNAYNV